jgi:hypothetical protein
MVARVKDSAAVMTEAVEARAAAAAL